MIQKGLNVVENHVKMCEKYRADIFLQFKMEKSSL